MIKQPSTAVATPLIVLFSIENAFFAFINMTIPAGGKYGLTTGG